jgi:phage terminase small subunit
MALTPQQEKFAQAIADGMNQTDAFKAHYSCDGWTQNAIYVNASKLMSNAKVSLRIKELKDALTEKTLWTRADSVETMKSVISDPESRATDKVAAVKVLNDMHGYNAPTEHKHSGELGISLNIKFV